MVLRISRELIGMLLIALFVFLFFFIDFTNVSSIKDMVPSDVLNMNTIFISIFLEAVPFVLIGIFVSALIQTFVSEHTVQKWIPKHPVLAVFPAALVGIVFPLCECVIVPVVRRLMQKGMPLHVGMVILVSVPILNPVVFASTYYAFRSAPQMASYRMGLAFIAALIIGLIMYALFRNRHVLRAVHEQPEAANRSAGRWKETLYHASDEFFNTGKYLLIGAFAASLFQTFFDRGLLADIGGNALQAPLVMMGFGYVLSLCSEADAFIAASFGHSFSASSLLAFLVFGPMIDLKNTLMLLAYFQARFVMVLIGVIAAVVYAVTQLLV